MRQFLTTHWKLKVLSLALAMVLWFVVSQEEKVVTVAHAPLEIKDIPPETIVVNNVEGLVSVKLRGSKSLVSGFILSQIDLPQGEGASRLRIGENHIRIDPKQISVPRGIEVQGVTPSLIHVVLERMASKELPVAPRIEGSPPRGFYVKRVVCFPEKVRVKGPERTLWSIAQIPTEPIPVGGKTEVFRQFVMLVAPSSHITWEEEELVQVAVTVEISKREE